MMTRPTSSDSTPRSYTWSFILGAGLLGLCPLFHWLQSEKFPDSAPEAAQSQLAVADFTELDSAPITPFQGNIYESSQAYTSILAEYRNVRGKPDWADYASQLELVYTDELESLARYIEAHPDLWEQEEWVTVLIQVWADRAGGAAVYTFLEDAFLDVDLHLREQARRSAYAAWAATSPAEALAVLNQSGLGDDRDYLTDAAIQSLNIQRIEDADTVLTYFDDSDSTDIAQAMIIRYLNAETLGDAALWLRETGGIDSVDAASQLAVRWVQHAPETAFQWLLELPRTAAKDQALNMALKVWVSTDPEGAGNYINQLDPSPELDVAVRAYALEAAAYDKEIAKEWAHSIFNDQLRAQTELSLARL